MFPIFYSLSNPLAYLAGQNLIYMMPLRCLYLIISRMVEFRSSFFCFPNAIKYDDKRCSPSLGYVVRFEVLKVASEIANTISQ